MEDKTGKEYHKENSQLSYLERLLPRLTAAWAYKRGNIERYRLEKIAQGDVPWKILRYEHVTKPESKIYPLKRTSYVRPETFEMQLRFLKSECNVVSLEQLTRALNSGSQLPDKSVALTFDGGYNDFYLEAAPLLSKYSVPCTVFVSPAYVGNDFIFWPDKVVGALFLLKSKGYEYPKFKEMGKRYYEVLDDLGGSEEISLGRAALLVDTMQKMSPDKRAEIMDQLGVMVEQLGGIPIERQFMDWQQLSEVSAAGFEIGTMGFSHKAASEIDLKEFESELKASFGEFERRGVRLRKYFAYPYGKFTKDCREVLFQNGFRHSFAIGDYPQSKPSRKRATVIGRTQMFEAFTYCKELFAARIWRVEEQVGIA
ncbi:MAG: polysaccharide deacetylase family protein [Bdellovibrionales bacterium]|nr:polysaccharide deacetylase family protein [Bdellovibrionales bacterium]